MTFRSSPSPEPRSLPAETVSLPGLTPVVPAELTEHPRYRVLEVLGEGALGTVYKAEHRLMHRTVALKVVRRELLEHAAARQRFLQEMRSVARLSHANIVAAHDAEQAGDLCFLAMEYVPGELLADLVERRGPMPVAKACDAVRQAALGLQHAHERGLVHRDIKPANLMLTPDGVVKILDFGLARFTVERASEHISSTGVFGTPAFMAPEQARQPHGSDIRADIYSLGCTLHFLLAGMVHTGPIADVQPDVPGKLEAVLERMAALDPEARYATPGEAAAALTPFCEVGAQRLNKPEQIGGRRQRRLTIAVAASSAAALLLLVGYLIFGVPGWLNPTNQPNRGQANLVDAGPEQPKPAPPGEAVQPKPVDDQPPNAPVVAAGAKAPRKLREWSSHQGAIECISAAPVVRRFLSSSSSEVVLWDLNNDRELQRLKAAGRVTVVAIAPDGAKALIGSDDGGVRLWGLPDGAELAKLGAGPSPIESLAFSPGEGLADNPQIKTMAYTTRAGFGALCQLDGQLAEVGWFRGQRFAFAADGQTMISASNKSLYRWLARKAPVQLLSNLPEDSVQVGAVAVSADGVRVVAASDGQARIAIIAGDRLGAGMNLLGHKNADAVAITADGRLAATGDRAGVLRLWDLSNWPQQAAVLLHQWQAHEGRISGLAFTDAKQFLSAGADRTIRWWSAGD